MLNKIKNTFFGSEDQKISTYPQQLEGDWKFTGYYPQQCKQLPSCHTKHMRLSLEDKDGTGYVFSTQARLEGETCSINDISFKDFGVSQAKSNKIYYGQSKLNNKYVFNWFSNPYYIDDNLQNEKLYIREKTGADNCWSTFQKTDEITEFEQKIHPMLSSYKRVPQERIKFTGYAGHPDLRALFSSLDEGANIDTPHMMISKVSIEKFGREVKAYADKRKKEAEFKEQMTELTNKLFEAQKNSQFFYRNKNLA